MYEFAITYKLPLFLLSLSVTVFLWCAFTSLHKLAGFNVKPSKFDERMYKIVGTDYYANIIIGPVLMIASGLTTAIATRGGILNYWF